MTSSIRRKGEIEIMYDGKVGPVSEEHREYLGDILTSARHLLQLINDVLDLSKVESGKMEVHPTTDNSIRVDLSARGLIENRRQEISALLACTGDLDRNHEFRFEQELRPLSVGEHHRLE